jgi:hypothetical protein
MFEKGDIAEVIRRPGFCPFPVRVFPVASAAP